MKDEEIYYQRAWHGSSMDFNEFSLEKDLTGTYGTRLRHLHGGE